MTKQYEMVDQELSPDRLGVLDPNRVEMTFNEIAQVPLTIRNW